MGNKTYAALTWLQRAGYEQPNNNLAMSKTLNDSKHAFPHEESNYAMSRRGAENFVNDCDPGTLASFSETREQLIQKAQRTGRL